MNTRVSKKSIIKFLLVAALIVGAAAYLIYFRAHRERIVLDPPLRGQVKTVEDLAGFDDLYEMISNMRGYDVSYSDFMKLVSLWAKKQGSTLKEYGNIETIDFISSLFKDIGFEVIQRQYSGPAKLELVVMGKWIDGKLHLLGIFRYNGVPDMDDSPDFMGFRWWDSFFAIDKSTGYIHMKYVMGTAPITRAYFEQPIPAMGLPASAYYAKFYERYIRRETIWWGNYIVYTDLWYADWGVLYTVLYPIEDFSCSSVAFDFIHSYMSPGLDIDFHQVLSQIDVVLNPSKGTTYFYLPFKVCKEN